MQICYRSLFIAQQRIRIDWRAMPKPLRITHLPQRKVEMRVLGTRVAGRADIAHDLPLSDLLTFPDAFGIAFKMRIVGHKRACRA